MFAAACKSDKSADRVVVVLDDRESLIDVDRVLDALERFGPGVICWEHCEGANPPMVPFVRTVVEQPEVQAEPELTETVPGRNIASPKLRLISNEQSNNQSNTESGAKSGLHTPTVSLPNLPKNGTISSCDVLNADELDALLSGEMGEGRRGK